MATTIKLKNGSGAPLASDLVQGEPAFDLTNKRLYTEDSGGNVIEVGTNPTSITTGTIDATTITADGLTVDASADVSINRVDASTFSATSPSADLVLSRKNTSNTTGETVGIRFDITGWNGSTTGGAAIEAVQADGNLSSADLVFTTRNNGTYGQRLRLSNDGDISFYEDTGTTAKFFWDASAESLGIGTSSPATELHIKTASGSETAQITIEGSTPTYNAWTRLGNFNDTTYLTNNYYYDSGQYSDSASVGGASVQLGNGVIQFGTSPAGTVVPAERMRIDSSGNVGIGTASPDTLLNIDGGASYPMIHIESSTNTSRSLYLGMDSATNHALTANGVGTNLLFKTEGTERARIDSSGNLLVGTTNSNWLTEDGTRNFSTGSTTHTANGIIPLALNRRTSDGTIAEFRKDGTTVGSIGTGSGDLSIGTGDTGIRFNDEFNSLLPVNTSTNALADASISLGLGAYRFKDLYLSGGVYLGGTGAANHLDDYETGEHVPTLTCGTSGTITLDSTQDTLQYTKTGDLVTVSGRIVVSSVSSPVGTLNISMPFTAANLTDTAGFGTGQCTISNSVSKNANDFIGAIVEATSSLTVYDSSGSAVAANVVANQIQASTILYISVSYRTA